MVAFCQLCYKTNDDDDDDDDDILWQKSPQLAHKAQSGWGPPGPIASAASARHTGSSVKESSEHIYGKNGKFMWSHIQHLEHYKKYFATFMIQW